MEAKTIPLAVIQLKGTQEEMGRQFGEIMLKIGQYEPIFDFYPVMAQNLLLGSLPRKNRNFLSKGFVSLSMKLAEAKMNSHRWPEYSKRTLAALKAAGIRSSIEKEMFTMDAFQNAVGLMGMLRVLPELRRLEPFLRPQLVPACTSVTVWGNQSKDRNLYHARNFDFPGVEVWDKRPIVVFCNPTDTGIRYGYVACRGADVPGITAFNEAGLTLSFHTRFHKKVGFSGLGVVDFGHKMISESRNIDEAVSLAKRYKINSTWGAILTNHNEKGSKAAVIETNFGNVEVTYSDRKSDCMVNTNHYFSPKLQDGELLAAPSFCHHTRSRFQRATQLLAEQKSRGTTVKDLQNLLNDSVDPTSGESRTMGSTIRQITSVKSVVMSPQAEKLYVSVGVAPTGSGPYLEIPMRWDSAPGYTFPSLPKKSKGNPSSAKKGKSVEIKSQEKKKAIEYYKEAMLINDDPKLGGIEDMLTRLEAGKESDSDPSLLFLRGILHIEKGEFQKGSYLLEETVRLESSPFRKQQAQLWLARTYSGLGRNALSARLYDEIRTAPDSLDCLVWKMKAKSDKGSYSLKKLRQVSPNFLLVDANEL